MLHRLILLLDRQPPLAIVLGMLLGGVGMHLPAIGRWVGRQVRKFCHR
jgi:hypothetical protein